MAKAVRKILDIEEIIEGCLKNDRSCKEMLYKSFYGFLLAIIMRYTKSTEDSEELVNDTFLKALNGLSVFKIPEDQAQTKMLFKAWMAKIASRSAIDHLRKRKHFLVVDELAEHDVPINDATVLIDMHVADILNLVNQLPDMSRLIFNLYEVEGFKHEEISKMLKIPESSSRVYLTRAKNKLRTLYTQTFIDSYRQNG